VRRKPFSVVLFDEIEKAAGRIMDKFLQILSDGRLTDGSGDTVFFNETVIIFTSNLGASEVKEMPLDSAEDLLAYERTIHDHIVDYFSAPTPTGLGRPEILSRIGENNIVVFRPITPDIGEELARLFIANILKRVNLQTGHTVTLSDEALKQAIAMSTSDLSLGGRGFTKALEEVLVNPLAHILFDYPDRQEYLIESIDQDDMGEERLRVADMDGVNGSN
jgi:ATP-dependent Clp protease ATP-binding subunit ClpA